MAPEPNITSTIPRPEAISIATLPIEILLNIFSSLESAVDSVCFSLVCKWLYLIHFDRYGSTADMVYQRMEGID
jgi:hypothetical protein